MYFRCSCILPFLGIAALNSAKEVAPAHVIRPPMAHIRIATPGEGTILSTREGEARADHRGEECKNAEDREMRTIGFTHIRGIARATLIFEVHREQSCHFFWSDLLFENKGVSILFNCV